MPLTPLEQLRLFIHCHEQHHQRSIHGAEHTLTLPDWWVEKAL